jgi:hypothetical protein
MRKAYLNPQHFLPVLPLFLVWSALLYQTLEISFAQPY